MCRVSAIRARCSPPSPEADTASSAGSTEVYAPSGPRTPSLPGRRSMRPKRKSSNSLFSRLRWTAGAEDLGVALGERAGGADLAALGGVAHEELRLVDLLLKAVVHAVQMFLLGLDLAIPDGVRGGDVRGHPRPPSCGQGSRSPYLSRGGDRRSAQVGGGVGRGCGGGSRPSRHTTRPGRRRQPASAGTITSLSPSDVTTSKWSMSSGDMLVPPEVRRLLPPPWPLAPAFLPSPAP